MSELLQAVSWLDGDEWAVPHVHDAGMPAAFCARDVDALIGVFA